MVFKHSVQSQLCILGQRLMQLSVSSSAVLIDCIYWMYKRTSLFHAVIEILYKVLYIFL